MIKRKRKPIGGRLRRKKRLRKKYAKYLLKHWYYGMCRMFPTQMTFFESEWDLISNIRSTTILVPPITKIDPSIFRLLRECYDGPTRVVPGPFKTRQ